MRYRFRGLKRDTGKAVEGHVEASTEDAAYEVLSDHGIVTESLRPDPRSPSDLGMSRGNGGMADDAWGEAGPRNPGRRAGDTDARGGRQLKPWDIADAIESAFDTSAQKVAVDKLAERFRGQRVWVIDREKIRRRVMQIVEQAIAQGTARDETHEQVRDRIASAVEKLFDDNRNLTSQAPPAPQSPPAPPAPEPQAQQPAQPAEASPSNAALEQQIDRLSRVVEGMERAVGNLTAALRSGVSFGGGGPARFSHEPRQRSEEQSAALLEIFQSNLELRREVEKGDSNAPSTNGEPSAERN